MTALMAAFWASLRPPFINPERSLFMVSMSSSELLPTALDKMPMSSGLRLAMPAACLLNVSMRVDRLLIDYFGVEDNSYSRAVIRKTLAAATARIYEPGTKFDSVLILNGPQGIGKSTFFTKLAGKWFSDSLTITDMRYKTAAGKLGHHEPLPAQKFPQRL